MDSAPAGASCARPSAPPCASPFEDAAGRLAFAPGVKLIRHPPTGRFALFNDCETPVPHYLVFEPQEAAVLALKEGCSKEDFRAAFPRQAEDCLRSFQAQRFFSPLDPPIERIRAVRRGYDAHIRAREAALRKELGERLQAWRADATRPWSTYEPPRDAPRAEISLLITDACNLRCRYCHVMDNAPDAPHAERVGVMSQATLEAFGRTFAQYVRRRWGVGCLNVVFFGGQPSLKGKVRDFLFRAAETLCALAAKEGVFLRLAIDDNGTQIDDELIAFFKRYGFYVSLSFDPPVEVHDRQRPFPGRKSKSGRTVEAGLMRLIEAGLRVGLRATVSALNQNRIREAVEDYAARGLTAAAFIPMQDIAHGRAVSGLRAPDAAILKREYLAAFDAVLDLFDRSGRTFDLGPVTSILHRIARGGEHQTCGMGDIYFAVDPAGRVYSCHRDLIEAHALGDVAEPGCAGRLLEPPLKKTCPQVTSFYDPALFCSCDGRCAAETETEAACAACPILAFCGGSCPAASLAHYGCTNIGVSVLVDSDPARGAERCRFSREFVEELFWRFVDEPPDSLFGRYCAALFGEAPA